MVIDGHRLARGDVVFPMLNAANRDPDQFASPDQLDLARTENRHIAFTRIMQALHDIRVAGTIDWIDSFGFRGVKALPLEFRAA